MTMVTSNRDYKYITLNSVAADIFNNVKDSIPITKDKLLLELYMVLRYKTVFSTDNLTISTKLNTIFVTGVYTNNYKISKAMRHLGFQPTMLSILNYVGYEKFDMFITESRKPHASLEDYIKGSGISLTDLKDTIKQLKKTDMTVLKSGELLKLNLDEFVGITLFPSPNGIKIPYYFTYEEFVTFCL